MEIDLSKVLAYSKDCLQSRAQMRSIMMDMYPGKTLEMNILLAVYESGIPKRIKDEGVLDSYQYSLFVEKIIAEYGLQRKYVIAALDEWISVIKPQRPDSGKVYDNVGNIHQSENAEGGFKRALEEYVYDEEGTDSALEGNGDISPQQPFYDENRSITYSDEQNFKINVISRDEVEIAKFVGIDDGVIRVPKVVDGKKVVSIGEGAFEDCLYMSEVILPDGITDIKNRAFKNCSGMKSIRLPKTLKNIGTFVNVPKTVKFLGNANNGCFYKCGLIKVEIPESVEYIGSGTFAHCGYLESVNMPPNVLYIGNHAFMNTKIKSFMWPKGLSYVNDYMFQGCEFGELLLPVGIVSLGEGAFCHCHDLTKVSMPQSLERIGNKAFEGCYKLRDVYISDGTVSIGKMAFAGCDALVELMIPQSVAQIEDSMLGVRPKVIIRCFPGSKAVEYARNNKLKMRNATQ